MLKKFILLVIFTSLALMVISVLLIIFQSPVWIYLTMYSVFYGLIPGGIAYLVLTGGRKD